MIAMIDALPTTTPPMAAPAANPNWIKVLFRLSMIPDASGAIETRLKFSVGPHAQAAMAQIISMETMRITDPEKIGISSKARAWAMIPPTSVWAAPKRSAKKPPSFDPIRLAIPKKEMMDAKLIGITQKAEYLSNKANNYEDIINHLIPDTSNPNK
jgi:hypothetical protein